MGVETSSSFRNNAGYIQSWVQALKEDTKAIVRASAKAEAAYYLIMGLDNPRAVEPSDADIKE
jgi:antirestriction protein ArdC